MFDPTSRHQTSATITLWGDRVEYRVQTTIKEGMGGSVPYSSHEGDRTYTLALGEALEKALQHSRGPLVVRVIYGA